MTLKAERGGGRSCGERGSAQGREGKEGGRDGAQCHSPFLGVGMDGRERTAVVLTKTNDPIAMLEMQQGMRDGSKLWKQDGAS